MHGIDGHRLNIATFTKSLAELFPFEEECRVGYFLSTCVFFDIVYRSWIASSTIGHVLLLCTIGFPFLKSSSSCRLGLNSTLFVSLSHYYNLEDTLSSGLLYKNPTQLFDQLLLYSLVQYQSHCLRPLTRLIRRAT